MTYSVLPSILFLKQYCEDEGIGQPQSHSANFMIECRFEPRLLLQKEPYKNTGVNIGTWRVEGTADLIYEPHVLSQLMKTVIL